MKTRRDFLHATGAALVVGAAIADGSRTPALSGSSRYSSGQAVNVSALSATLTFADGSARNFVGANGIDLGDFTVPFAGISQRNVIVRSDDKLFSVHFRPDRNDERIEVVVLYGDPFNDAPATMGSYTCEIFNNGVSLEKVDVPQHFWLSRWRWQSSPRPRVRRPADLVAANLSVAYERSSMTIPLPREAKPYEIMGASNITLFMGETGDRMEIGQNPEYTSAYMATEDGGMYNSMMTWAEASASGPWHINDPTTNGIINWDNWGKFTTWPEQPLNQGPAIHPFPHPIPKNACIRPDEAHHPCLSYIPFLLTGDPFHMEELQYQTNYYLGLGHDADVKSYIFDRLQTRGWAWTLRSTVFAYLACGSIRGGSLLPQGFWKKVLDNNLSWITDNCVNGQSAKERVFFSGTSKHAMGWWQEDYLCGVLAMAVRLGFSDWLPVLKWKIQSDINRINGTSGWPRTRPTMYYTQYYEGVVTPAPGNVGNGSPGFIAQDPRSFPTFGEWSVEFSDSSNFTVYRPGHISDDTGQVGKKFDSDDGPEFTISQGSVPFAAGDKFIVNLNPITDWANLARVNNVAPTSGDDLENIYRAYVADVYAVMALAMPVMPEVKPLFEWLSDAMQGARDRIPWRDSFAV